MQGINILLLGIAVGILQYIIVTIIAASTLSSTIYSYGYNYTASAVANASIWGTVSIIFAIVWITFGVIELIGIVNAASGNAKTVPILGKIRIIKK
jgi:hypothetical protein